MRVRSCVLAVVLLAACGGKGHDNSGNGGSGGNGGGGGSGPPTPPPVAPPAPPMANQDYCGPALPGLLDCRNGAEALWQTSLGPVDNFNACDGSLSFEIAGVVIDSGAAGGPVSAVPGASGDRLECGPGCALPADKVLVLSDTTPPVVTILAGHDQMKFAWSDDRQSWQAEPYVYRTLVAANAQGASPMPLTSGFAAADVWVLYDRELGYEAYVRYGSEKVWRIAESNDALASLQKRTAFANGQTPATLGTLGRTTAYVRDDNGYLVEMRDYRYPDVTALVVGRDASAGNRISQLTFVQDNTGMTSGSTVKLGYADTTPTAALQTITANGEAASTLTFANNQLTTVIDPTGDKYNYSYRTDGRLRRVWHDALNPQASPPETASFDFAYADCKDGSAIADDAAAGTFACKVTMTDEDGFAYWTQLSPFDPTANAPQRAYVSAEGRTPGGAYYNMSFVRSSAGYLVKKSSASGATTQWTPGCGDGKPGGKWTVERTDGPGSDPSMSVDASRIQYVARQWDEDNVVLREVSNAGETTTTYQKANKLDPSLAWANLLPATITTTTFDASGKPVKMSPQTIKVESGGKHGGSFLVTLDTPFGGGSTVVEFDNFLRPVAHQNPGDAGDEFATTTYDAYGFVATEKSTGGAMQTAMSHYPSGNSKTVSLQVCGQQREAVSFGENQFKDIASRTTTLGSDVGITVMASDYLPDGTPKTMTVTTPSYTRTEQRVYAPAGAVLEGMTVTNVAGGNNDVETSAWHTKGY